MKSSYATWNRSSAIFQILFLKTHLKEFNKKSTQIKKMTNDLFFLDAIIKLDSSNLSLLIKTKIMKFISTFNFNAHDPKIFSSLSTAP